MPALGVRADVFPGAVTRVALPALAPGRYIFLCDVFCGDNHEEMDGVVVAA
jgi:cytochrome c oxidase subunit 2